MDESDQVSKKVMPEFIAAMYSVVIGVSSLKLVSSFSDIVMPFKTMPAPSPGHEPIAFPDFLFKLVFFGFTLLIAAHDWFTYKGLDRKEKQKHPFWSFTPYIGCLFCMAQMLLAAANNEMIPWYIAGLFYTIFNWLNRGNIEDTVVKNALVCNYGFHLGICVAAVVALLCTNKLSMWWVRWIVLLLTIVIVVILWHRIDKIVKEQSQKKQPPAGGNNIPASQTAPSSPPAPGQGQATTNKDTAVKTYHQLLARINNLARKELFDNRLLIWVGIGSGLIALVVLICWIYGKPHYQQIALGIFGTSSIVGGIATVVYLLLREEEIKTRNMALLEDIEKGMDPAKPVLGDAFYEKLAAAKLDDCLTETPKNPLQS